MRTAVVILNWNTKGFLRRFIPSLLKSLPQDASLIVADSASTDGSMEMLSEMFPSVTQIRLDDNFGFTGGYNRAFKAVCRMQEASEMEYFLLLNSDIEVEDGWLEPLVRWMDTHPDCAACAPKLHSWQDKDSFEYAGAAGGLMDFLGYTFCRGRVMKRLEKDCGQYDGKNDVFWASGACLMVRKDEFERIGGLDDRFFAHMEEIDLCWRLQLEGKRICVVPQSVVRHVGGGTLPNDSPWKLKLNYRNNLLMLQNNLAKTYGLQEIKESIPEKAAEKACRRASWTIFIRKVLDGCSALVYRLTGKKDCYKAVLEAHREVRRIGRTPSVKEITEYVSSHRTISVPALFPHSIVALSLLKGKGVFEYIRKES
ncbi:MAG: glycosyltransferase family 2 protein [Bacteroidales bacterium]|nr:glycosyltransferase family 2 protein [Bacteroidales bacterium]